MNAHMHDYAHEHKHTYAHTNNKCYMVSEVGFKQELKLLEFNIFKEEITKVYIQFKVY